jgi:hypothetical protein
MRNAETVTGPHQPDQKRRASGRHDDGHSRLKSPATTAPVNPINAQAGQHIMAIASPPASWAAAAAAGRRETRSRKPSQSRRRQPADLCQSADDRYAQLAPPDESGRRAAMPR